MGLYFFDDLNTYTLGVVPPSPWHADFTYSSLVNSQVDVEVDPAVGGAQGRVIRLYENNPAGGGPTYHTILSRSLGFVTGALITFDLKVRCHFNDSRLYIGVVDNSGNFRHSFDFHSNGWCAIPTSGIGDGYPSYAGGFVAYNTDQWYQTRWTYDVNWGTRDVTIDGVNYGSQAQGFRAANIAGIAVMTEAASTFTRYWYIDDARAVAGRTTRTGVVRNLNGQIVSGATVLVIRQVDRVLIAQGTTDTAGNFSIEVPAPDDVACTFAAYRNISELGSARPWVDVF